MAKVFSFAQFWLARTVQEAAEAQGLSIVIYSTPDRMEAILRRDREALEKATDPAFSIDEIEGMSDPDLESARGAIATGGDLTLVIRYDGSLAAGRDIAQILRETGDRLPVRCEFSPHPTIFDNQNAESIPANYLEYRKHNPSLTYLEYIVCRVLAQKALFSRFAENQYESAVANAYVDQIVSTRRELYGQVAEILSPFQEYGLNALEVLAWVMAYWVDKHGKYLGYLLARLHRVLITDYLPFDLFYVYGEDDDYVQSRNEARLQLLDKAASWLPADTAIEQVNAKMDEQFRRRNSS